MRRRITKALLATATAGATVIGFGLAAAGSASAAERSPNINPSSAGWAAGNILTTTPMTGRSTWNFRYATGTTRVPDVTQAYLSDNQKQEVFSSQLSNKRGTFAAQLYWKKSTSKWQIQFRSYYRLDLGLPSKDYTLAKCNSTVKILPGDQVRLDVYYDQGEGSIQFTAYDNSVQLCQKYAPAWRRGTIGGGRFQEAYVGGVFTRYGTVAGNPYRDAATGSTSNAWARPAGSARLFSVSNTHFTSYDGTHGTVIGPWSYRELVFGTSFANIYANAPHLYNYGENFRVWVRG